jgi:hypothetical protein
MIGPEPMIKTEPIEASFGIKGILSGFRAQKNRAVPGVQK